MKNVVLYTTHFIDNKVVRGFRKLLNDTVDCDVYLLFNDSKNECTYNYDKIYIFNKESVTKLGFQMRKYYPNSSQRGDFYGHNFEYGIMSFYKTHPEYETYWIVEHDAYFNGNWNNLFKKYNTSLYDFVSSNIVTFNNSSKLWQTFLFNLMFTRYKISNNDKIRTFNPVFMISNRALSFLIKHYDEGNYGFYECFFPTVLKLNGFDIKQFDELIGNNGDMITSSMRYSPNTYWNKEHMKPNILYHPYDYGN